MLNLPNIITLGRIVLVPVFLGLVLRYRETGAESFRWWAVAVFFVAAASDAVDGMVARLKDRKTVLGSFLDPLADKLLLITAVIVLSIPVAGLARLPSWFPLLVISRDLIIVLGSALIHMLAGKVTPTPLPAGKCTTFFQMLTVVWILLRVPHPLLPLLLATLFTVISGGEYVALGVRQLHENAEGR
ncbi:MAG: CDP-alcohol phosphatidyltransferase family protein [bacterium]|nr:CDP-alcohol phosphatidyltransferase family protein [bacterium]